MAPSRFCSTLNFPREAVVAAAPVQGTANCSHMCLAPLEMVPLVLEIERYSGD